MRVRKMMCAYAAVFLSAGFIGIFSGSVYAYLNPLVKLNGLWSSRYYFDTKEGEYQIDTVLGISGRNIYSSSIISDTQGKTVAARSAKMAYQKALRADGTNLYTLHVDYSKPFPNLDEPILADQSAFFDLIRVRFYVLDCNQFVLDTQPAPHINYSAIFRRVEPRKCGGG